MSAIPDPWRALAKELKKIKERLDSLSNKSPFTGSGMEIIDAGQIVQDGAVVIPSNGLLLVDGGDVVMLNEALVEVFRLGMMDNGDRGLTIAREDGSKAIEIKRAFTNSTEQNLSIWDRSGRLIGGDSPLAPSGFDAPHIPMPFIPVDYTSNATAQTTSSATFVALHEHRGFRQNPALAPLFMVKCSDPDTAAEVRIWDVVGNVYLGLYLGFPTVETITVPAGTTAFTQFTTTTPLQLPQAMSQPIHLQVHARVTAGTGSVSVAPVRTIGTGF